MGIPTQIASNQNTTPLGYTTQADVLTEQKLWSIIQTRLGIPYTFFELSYTDVMNYLKKVTLLEFSKHVPYYMRLSARALDERGSVYQIDVPAGIQILGVINVLNSFTSGIFAGMPINPIIPNYDSAGAFLLKAQQAKLRMNTSMWLDFTWRFQSPDTLYLIPAIRFDALTVEAKTTHPSFITIPAKFQKEFIDLCIADVKQLLGEIRSRYQNYQTFFGSIELSADRLLSEAEQLRQQVIERLNTLPPYKLVSKGGMV